MLLILISLVLLVSAECRENLKLLSKSRTSFLEHYRMYMDAVILHLSVPDDTPFISFKIIGEELDVSIFNCDPQDIEMYFKYGSPPVINPDGSKFPKGFFLSRSSMWYLKFKSNKIPQYINITSPAPGSYYAAVFKSFINPQNQGITQAGLSPQCFTFVEGFLYAQLVTDIFLITEMQDIVVYSNSSQIFKFYVPELIDHVTVTLENIKVTGIRILIQENNVPTINASEISYEIRSKLKQTFKFWTQENSWYYIRFVFPKREQNLCKFVLKFFSAAINTSISENETILYQNAVGKMHRSDSITSVVQYRQYYMIRDVSSESFVYSFDLEAEINSMIPLSVNLTNTAFSVLKFKLRQGSDIGGTMQIILAFKPRVVKNKNSRTFDKEPDNHVVVACISNGGHELPVLPGKCMHNSTYISDAPMVLNSSNTNSTIYIPYPDAGWWYISFKLFCNKCEPCKCPEKCDTYFKKCVQECELNCSEDVCNSCFKKCEENVMEIKDCISCNCDGPCQKTNETCNSSLVFDISSYPCVNGKCSANGKCMFTISQGVVYSTCVCMNDYKGWDCSDDSDANSYAMIVLELLLLVFSNIMFIPSAYIAYKRKYYVEAIVYFSTCFFSTFYHACDAGENVISFCITKLQVLQFSDFFSAILSIWVTLIAMAYLPSFWPSICHMLGAILIAFGTTINKQSLWVFVIPVVDGLIIIAISWYMKYRKSGRLFPSKKYLLRYLPAGLVTVAIGLIMYTFLQTRSNYKYLHSIWHILMAIAVIFLLPDERSFLPEPLLT